MAPRLSPERQIHCLFVIRHGPAPDLCHFHASWRREVGLDRRRLPTHLAPRRQRVVLRRPGRRVDGDRHRCHTIVPRRCPAKLFSTGMESLYLNSRSTYAASADGQRFLIRISLSAVAEKRARHRRKHYCAGGVYRSSRRKLRYCCAMTCMPQTILPRASASSACVMRCVRFAGLGMKPASKW